MGFRCRSGGPTVEDLYFPYARAGQEDIQNLDLTAPIGAVHLESALHHHVDAWDLFSLAKDGCAIRKALVFTGRR